MRPFNEVLNSENVHDEDSEDMEQGSEEEEEEEDDDDDEEEEEDYEEEEHTVNDFEQSDNDCEGEDEANESLQNYTNSSFSSSSKNVTTSHNGSTSSGTLGLYSSFDNIIGGSFHNKSPDHSTKYDNSKLEEHDISSHLKGALSFGLPSKGTALRINRPYKILKKRPKFLQARSRKSSRGRGGRVVPTLNSKKINLLKTVEKKMMERENIDHLDEDLKIGYRIVMELMGDSLKAFNSVFMETIELDPKVNGDYLEVVKEPVWLPRVKEKLLNGEYKSITEVISQIRLMLENTYRYFGASHSFSRRGIRLEYVLEQKIALLPNDVKSKCSLEVTHGVSEEEFLDKTRTKSASITVNGENYFSYLLYKVRGCRQAREKELKKKRLDMMRQAKVSKENELLTWDENLNNGPLGGPIRNMWELVQVNQFLYLSQKVLNITEVSQYEIERILSIPEASLTLRMLMTSLVTPRQQRAKLAEKPHMPYSVWARRLANKTFHWYRVYSRESHNSEKVFEQLGIEPKFWLVCGEENPFRNQLFHEMTLYQRVWLLKALCDYIYHTHKSVQETIAEQQETKMREIVLGKDSLGNEYIHFPHLEGSDLRVYRRTPFKCSNYETKEEKERKNKGRVFSKEQIKSFKKLIKKLKRNRERDEDWEYEQYKLKNRIPKKRGRRPYRSVTPNVQAPEKRTRPERLRQTPKPRYNLYSMELLDDDIDDEWETGAVKYSSSRKRKRKDGEEDDSDEDESEDDETSEDDQAQEQEEHEDNEEAKDEVKKEKPKEKKLRRGSRKQVCKTCGKSFSSKSAMYGHMASHVKKKEKQQESTNEKEENNEIKEENEEKKEIGDLVKVKTEENEECDEKGKITDIKPINDEILNEYKIKMEGKESNECPEDEERTSERKEVCTGSMEKVTMKELAEEDALKSPEGYPEQIKERECVSEDLTKEPMNGDEVAVNGDKLKELTELCDKKELNEPSDNQNNEDENMIIKEKEETVEEDTGVESDLKNKKEAPSGTETPSDDTGVDNETCSLGTPAETIGSSSEPDSNEFELVVASFAELRNLILKFGSLPSKYAKERKALQENDDDKTEEEEEEETEEAEDGSDTKSEANKDQDESKGEKEAQLPKCEQKLHRALCKLLVQLAPFEGKMNAFQRQLRRKLWSEHVEWSKRDSSYIDPSEEAWKSDPDPEPTPSATQTPKQSSSSSSSEESYNVDGTRKRKLRKRKVKRPPPEPPSPPAAADSRASASSPVDEPEEDMIAVSSRGRVRKVKRIVNYDRLDFDKLAKQAEKEAEKEKEQRRKKKEEEAGREKALQEAAQSLHLPSSGVRRYIISKEGEVVGYIGNDGQVHSGHLKVKEEQKIKPQIQQQTVKREQPSPKKDLEDKTPKVVVSALNENGTLVYVRMVGNQALELMKLIESSKNDPPRQIKLQRFSQTYTFSTNSYVMTQNIPGYEDSDTSNPQFLSKGTASSLTSKNVPLPIRTPAAVTSSEPTSSSIATPTCKSPNPVALAYQGLPSSTNSSQTSQKSLQSSSCASLSHTTNLVFASPSTVPSVSPMTTSSGVKLPVTPPTSVSSPLLVQTENGQQIQIGITSDRLSQMVQKAGQRVVAVPNDKGGYTISLISAVTSQGTTVSKSPQASVASNVQKPVITQLVPSVVTAGSTGHSIPIIKGRIQQQPLVQAAALPSQVMTHYTVNSPVANSSPPVARQVVIQQHNPVVSTPTNVLTNPTQPQQQVVHIGQPSILPQPQQSILQIQQQPPQKVVQVVHSSGGRPIVQMIQPGQVLVSGNNVANSVSSMQPHHPTGLMVNSTQALTCPKQPALIQPQVILQQSPQGSKIIQVANLDQFTQQQQQSQQLQYQDQAQAQAQPTPQPQAQQIIIQPQHFIMQQQQQNQQQPQQPQPQSQPQATHTFIAKPSQVQQRAEAQTPVSQQIINKVQSRKVPPDNPSITQSSDASVTQTTENANKQVGRLVLLQMSDGQKVYLQMPDGRLSMLPPEQLQPLIKSGAIKLTS